MDKPRPTVNAIVICERPEAKEQCRSVFGISGLKTEIVESEEALFNHLARENVEVILIARADPVDHTLNLIHRLRHPGSLYRDIPLVVVFPPKTPLEQALQSLHVGAYDYLIEPFSEIELVTKITVLAKIKHAEDEFRELAIRDVLTGLYDRRYLFIRLDEEMSRARRYSKPIACLVLDMDGMRQVNEKYGADAGDALLTSVADKLRHYKREIDVLARKNADCFAMVLYNTDQPGAMVLSNRLLSKVRDLVPAFDPAFHPSMSIGLAVVETSPEAPLLGQELLERAEIALRFAKREGGGRVAVYTTEIASQIMM